MREEVNQVISMMKLSKRISNTCPLNGEIRKSMDFWCFLSNGPLTPGSYSSFMFTLHVLGLIEVIQVESASLF